VPDIIPWIRSYFAAEHAALVAVLTLAPDAKARLLAARKHYGPGCGPHDFSYPDEPDPDRARKSIERRLFAVRHFDGFDQAIASDLYQPAPVLSMFAGFFVARRKIVARANACMSCDASGRHAGRPCRDCAGAGWVMVGAERLDLTAPTGVTKVEPPTAPESRATWDAW